MRILVIGATGTIGRAVVAALSAGNEIVPASRQSTAITVDLAEPASIREMYRSAGKVDAVVCAAGQAKFAPLAQLSDADFRYCLDNKLMGQVNVVRLGVRARCRRRIVHAHDRHPRAIADAGGAAISLVNAGVEGFVRGAALEAPRGIRVNAVSPPWVTETLLALKMDPSQGLPAAVVARAYVRSVTGKDSGATLEPSP